VVPFAIFRRKGKRETCFDSGWAVAGVKRGRNREKVEVCF